MVSITLYDILMGRILKQTWGSCRTGAGKESAAAKLGRVLPLVMVVLVSAAVVGVGWRRRGHCRRWWWRRWWQESIPNPASPASQIMCSGADHSSRVLHPEHQPSTLQLKDSRSQKCIIVNPRSQPKLAKGKPEEEGLKATPKPCNLNRANEFTRSLPLAAASQGVGC